jgi:hypothetical protein
MSTGADSRLHSIAEAVADETPVDWDVALGETPAAAATLENLRALAALARASREAGADLGMAHADPEGRALFRWGSLSVLERLGGGSFGEVYRAWDPTLRREVALKLRHSTAGPGSDRRWLEEARRLARVRHPNVLVVHGANVHDGRAGLWTDLLQGSTLEQLLAARGPFGAKEAALVGIELCGALASVHAAGLVHGDVKTSNVMREGEPGTADGSGRIVLMDFGSAHDAGPGGDASFGTPLAVAPEVLAGEDATPASDVYSLGVLLFRLVTGRYPVEGATVADLTQRHARGERAALRTLRPDLPASFVAAVERALEPSPEARFPDAAAMERALVSGIVPAAGQPGARARRAPAALLAVLGAVALAALAWFALAPRSGDDGERGAVSAIPDRSAPVLPPSPGAPPAEVPAAPALAPPQVEADLVRGEDDLGAPLATGDLVAPGDRIALELRAAEPVHAYVLAEDDEGSLFVLFPLRDRGARNPLAPGVRHRLPGEQAGEALDWVVTSAGGREAFLVLAAREPLRSVEQAVARIPAARSGEAVQYAPLSASALEGLRGVGGVAARPKTAPARAGARRLAALAADLDASPQGRAVWRKLVVLENPVP